jgi:hypothetical protein
MLRNEVERLRLLARVARLDQISSRPGNGID